MSFFCKIFQSYGLITETGRRRLSSLRVTTSFGLMTVTDLGQLIHDNVPCRCTTTSVSIFDRIMPPLAGGQNVARLRHPRQIIVIMSSQKALTTLEGFADVKPLWSGGRPFNGAAYHRITMEPSPLPKENHWPWARSCTGQLLYFGWPFVMARCAVQWPWQVLTEYNPYSIYRESGSIIELHCLRR